MLLQRFRASHALGLDPGHVTARGKQNASKQKTGTPVLIQSEPIVLNAAASY
jgi:hypothetical protein